MKNIVFSHRKRKEYYDWFVSELFLMLIFMEVEDFE